MNPAALDTVQLLKLFVKLALAILPVDCLNVRILSNLLVEELDLAEIVPLLDLEELEVVVVPEYKRDASLFDKIH